jgi:effector-binding domain-containing protein
MRGSEKAHWTAVVAACLALAVFGGALLAAETDEAKVTVEKRDASVVLYTIYRGSYDEIGPAIGKLFGLAAQKEIIPRGPVTLCYLNNPQETTPEHYLTEIRIPVAEGELMQTGTLGEMTDVKKLPATQVAVVEKSAGQSDPSVLHEALFKWVGDNGYEVAGGPTETFAENAQGGNYSQIKTVIALPVQKKGDKQP